MDTLQSTISENLTGGNKVASPEHAFTLDQVPSQDGKGATLSGCTDDTLADLPQWLL